MLKRILATIGTRDYPVRRQALHRTMEAMKLGHSLTLGGCQILDKPKEWWVTREPVGIGKDVLVPHPGIYLWDSRFTVEVFEDIPCRIAALGEEGIQKLGVETKKNVEDIPHIVLQTLPALWQNEKLLGLLSTYTFTPHFPLIQ